MSIKDTNKRISVKLPIKLYDLIKIDADYDDRSMSNYILKILKQHYNINNNEDE